MLDKRLDNLPMILETPEPEIWPDEIIMLKKMVLNYVQMV
jgi:endonuclease IV